jgi:hypothetical protein
VSASTWAFVSAFAHPNCQRRSLPELEWVPNPFRVFCRRFQSMQTNPFRPRNAFNPRQIKFCQRCLQTLSEMNVNRFRPSTGRRRKRSLLAIASRGNFVFVLFTAESVEGNERKVEQVVDLRVWNVGGWIAGEFLRDSTSFAVCESIKHSARLLTVFHVAFHHFLRFPSLSRCASLADFVRRHSKPSQSNELHEVIDFPRD